MRGSSLLGFILKKKNIYEQTNTKRPLGNRQEKL